jgi:hypothetical protein
VIQPCNILWRRATTGNQMYNRCCDALICGIKMPRIDFTANIGGSGGGHTREIEKHNGNVYMRVTKTKI